MDIAYEVANYLEDNNFGTVGVDIFVSTIPEEKEGIYIQRLGGNLSLYTPINEAVLLIYIKDNSASNGVATAESIKNFMHRMVSTTTSNSFIFTFLFISDVEDLGRDLENYNLYKLTLQVKYRASDIIS